MLLYILFTVVAKSDVRRYFILIFKEKKTQLWKGIDLTKLFGKTTATGFITCIKRQKAHRKKHLHVFIISHDSLDKTICAQFGMFYCITTNKTKTLSTTMQCVYKIFTISFNDIRRKGGEVHFCRSDITFSY